MTPPPEIAEDVQESLAAFFDAVDGFSDRHAAGLPRTCFVDDALVCVGSFVRDVVSSGSAVSLAVADDLATVWRAYVEARDLVDLAYPDGEYPVTGMGRYRTRGPGFYAAARRVVEGLRTLGGLDDACPATRRAETVRDVLAAAVAAVRLAKMHRELDALLYCVDDPDDENVDVNVGRRRTCPCPTPCCSASSSV